MKEKAPRWCVMAINAFNFIQVEIIKFLCKKTKKQKTIFATSFQLIERHIKPQEVYVYMHNFSYKIISPFVLLFDQKIDSVRC